MQQARLAFTTTKFEESLRFYAEGLGGQIVAEWDAPARGAVIRLAGAACIELFEAQSAHSVEPPNVMFAIEVEDVDEWHDRAQRAGANLVRAPTDQPWGLRDTAFTDPNGLRIALFQALSAHPE